mmetsp:Transcript_35627/g.68779  ORF Transcript_35627/g.68779 Transcript_35627/m.68779 type:complete len:101 (+) Transcript_35627:244-546(+)
MMTNFIVPVSSSSYNSIMSKRYSIHGHCPLLSNFSGFVVEIDVALAIDLKPQLEAALRYRCRSALENGFEITPSTPASLISWSRSALVCPVRAKMMPSKP